MNKEAMKLALEALETERPYLGPMPTKTSKAITALREALAEQPARPYRQLQDNGSKYFGPSWDKADQALDKPQKRPQNCGTGYCSCIECVMEPAQHEPVQETLQQQLEKAKAALYNARADTRRIQQIIMRQS